MTKEEVIEMAIQVGIKHRTDEFYSKFCDGVYFDDLVDFAKLIVEKEREACAKIADEYAEGLERNYSELIANQIRARGQK